MEDLTLALITLTSFVLLFVVAIFAGVAAIVPADNTIVRAGDVIFKIDDGDYRIAVDAARTKIATQQATIDRITPVAFGLVYALTGAVMKRNRAINSSWKLKPSQRVEQKLAEPAMTPPTPRVVALAGPCRRM